MRVRGLWTKNDFDELFSQIADYRRRLFELTGVDLSQAKVLEVGYGQRPNRLRALMSMNVSAIGLDLDRPVLRGSVSEFIAIGRQNGFQRLLKSLVRHHLFDVKEQNQLASALRKRGFQYRVDHGGFLVGSVASSDIDKKIPPGSLDLIYSEDVFEHIPQDELKIAVSRMRRWLKPTGIALIRLTLFTGITGGHHTEWYSHTIRQSISRRTEPWEHLRQKRFSANTYLNEVRFDDYLKLFSNEFDIIEIVKDNYGMGQEFLIPQVRQDLREYADDELLTNEVLFALKPKIPSAMN
jgi:hypothetical protein